MFTLISGCALRISVDRNYLPENGSPGVGCQKNSERSDVRRIDEVSDRLIGERSRLFLRDGAAAGQCTSRQHLLNTRTVRGARQDRIDPYAVFTQLTRQGLRESDEASFGRCVGLLFG